MVTNDNAVTFVANARILWRPTALYAAIAFVLISPILLEFSHTRQIEDFLA